MNKSVVTIEIRLFKIGFKPNQFIESCNTLLYRYFFTVISIYQMLNLLHMEHSNNVTPKFSRLSSNSLLRSSNLHPWDCQTVDHFQSLTSRQMTIAVYQCGSALLHRDDLYLTQMFHCPFHEHCTTITHSQV